MSRSLLTNDGIYSDYMDKYEDSIDFFEGADIAIKRKNEDDLTPEIEGLENLARTFHSYKKTKAVLNTAGKIALNVFQAIIALLSDIKDWIKSVIFNKISRLSAKIKYTEQKRKLNGVGVNEIAYPRSIHKLFVPSTMDTNPIWVIASAKKAYTFYEDVMTAQKQLKSYLSETPSSPDELMEVKKTVIRELGKKISHKEPGQENYQTDILPGGRIYNIKKTPSNTRDEVMTFFTESPTSVRLKSQTWTPSEGLIDDALDVAKKGIELITTYQKNINDLIDVFIKNIHHLKNKNENLDVHTQDFYTWLGILNKRLVSSTIHYILSVIETLNTFINAGIKENA